MDKKIFNLANRITFSRVIFSLALFALLCVSLYVSPTSLILIPETHFTVLDLVCFVLFIVLGSTDSVDGHIARSRNQVTDLGKVLDPLADKLLVDGTMIILSCRSPMLLPPLFTILFVGRDLLVDGVRIMAASKGKVIPANIYGKIKTVMEMTFLPIVILRGFPLNFIDWAFDNEAYSAWAGSLWNVADNYSGETAAMIFCLVLGGLTLIASLVSGGIYLWRARHVFTEQGSEKGE